MNPHTPSPSSPTPTPKPEQAAVQNSDHKPTKLRRLLSIRSRGRHASNKLKKHPEPNDTSASMTILSPRPTETEPCEKRPPKRSLSSFLLRRSSGSRDSVPPLSPSPSPSPSIVPLPSQTGVRGRELVGQGHLPVTETSCLFPLPLSTAARVEGDTAEGGHELGSPAGTVGQKQSRKDSVVKSSRGVSASRSRAAALTSHPVGEEDGESEDEFLTPGEFWGRQKGDYVG
ncbi:hypothetical protein EKO04_004774 [Ascochyta lentis]|uniref:Uncharacterized protein n=1 Tax=Ascochyta lentis TaxID=205686 RepID=A0A8H7MJ91_9PLEO|nr:hypothetical protein EKO04_004774 [Ascochyta lentis]